MQPNPTSLVLKDRLSSALSAGQIDTRALRSAFPNLSDHQFAFALFKWRRDLRKTGVFLTPVTGKPGVLERSTAEQVVHKAMESSRLAVVRKVRDRGDLLVAAQKTSGLDEESRSKLNAEEIVYSRFVQVAERMLLKSQRKKPEGLEE
jgi:hypothetical protein